jgi:hypothetical protein
MKMIDFYNPFEKGGLSHAQASVPVLILYPANYET